MSIRELREKVEAGTLSAEDWSWGAGPPDWSWDDFFGAYHGSLDAALALHKAVLPGWGWRVGMGNVYLYPLSGPKAAVDIQPIAPDGQARAWLAAILRAMER